MFTEEEITELREAIRVQHRYLELAESHYVSAASKNKARRRMHILMQADEQLAAQQGDT